MSLAMPEILDTTSARPLDPARFRRVLVLGLGASGKAATRLLLARGVAVVGVDRRASETLDLGAVASSPGFTLSAGGDGGELPASVDALVVSPGVSLGHPLLEAARRASVPVLAEVELAYHFLEGRVVAVTGSNGKSTTTALAGELLRSAGFAVEVCGNIGTPLAAVVDGPPGRVFVVELSSFQLETIHDFRARAAALLNLSPDHLDRHGSLGAYLAAKRRIFANQEPGDVAILNADEAEIALTPSRARRRFFSSTRPVADGCFLDGDTVVELSADAGPRPLFARSDVPLPGLHNVENAMAAALLALSTGAEVSALAPALRSFRGLPHRLELVAEARGVRWYDDSKGTNVASTARSLEGFADASVHVILGGRNKGADLRYLAPVVAKKAKRAYLIGESAAAFETALAGVVPLSLSGSLERAVDDAAREAAPGDVVVLSPACASFDQFRDFADRGERFAAFARRAAARAEGS